MGLTSSRRDVHRSLPSHTDDDRRRIVRDAYGTLLEDLAYGDTTQERIDAWLKRHPEAIA